MWQVEVSFKSEMADPLNMGDTIISNHLTLVHTHLCSCNRCKTVPTLHLMWLLDAICACFFMIWHNGVKIAPPATFVSSVSPHTSQK